LEKVGSYYHEFKDGGNTEVDAAGGVYPGEKELSGKKAPDHPLPDGKRESRILRLCESPGELLALAGKKLLKR